MLYLNKKAVLWRKIKFGFFFSILSIAIVSYQCSFAQADKYLFQKLSSSQTNLHFVNEITDSLSRAAGKYVYIVNSSGTGVADLNGDGKPDIFFSSNTGENKLYLNEGGFKFKDVTAEANIKGNGKWGTGVCIADINGDGLLDIYIAHSGNFNDIESLSNEAYICTGIDANGVPHYEERAKELGLDLPGSNTTQVAFFDYDRDGDLDCFVLNHSRNAYGERLIGAEYTPDTSTRFIGYDVLLRNDFKDGKQHFTNVTKEAGILNSMNNFGLGVIVTDFNGDGWPDVYATSDFAERDFLYINNHDGTFTESCMRSLKHISNFSMGVDGADINNDLMPDLITVDMLPDDNYHLKLQQQPDNNDQFNMMVKLGLSYQYRKNTLQLNMGSENGIPKFADIAEMAGVSATNWSWTPLFVDVNNDGWKDLFVSNGYYKDYTNQDAQNRFITNKKENLSFGPKKLNSFLFLNNKSLSLTNVESWKAADPEMSYSACVADFDGDGNLDILINNLNNEPSLLKNVIKDPGNFINIKLKENDKNTYAIGAKVYVTCNNQTQLQEMENVRGYQSSQDYVLHFGLGNTKDQVKIRVVWPDGSETEKTTAPHTTITFTKDNTAKMVKAQEKKNKYRFNKVENFCSEDTRHIENKYNDFKYQFTIPYKQSQCGPAVAEGDINDDGITDYYIGGSTGNLRYLLLGQKDGTYKKYIPPAFYLDTMCEDVAAVFFDIDGDGYKDLVVISGGVEHPGDLDFFTDRIYKNNGKGEFEKVLNVFPKTNITKSCVAVGDFDHDGKPDLFIGGYTTAGNFVKVPQSFIFKNQSTKNNIQFKDVTETVLPEGDKPGMVTSATWIDLNGDNYPELVISGEWMPCKIFNNQNGILKADTKISGFKDMPGWYQTIYPTDYDGDGKLDFIVGNEGNDSHFRASKEKPMKVFDIKDSTNKAIFGFLFSYYFKDIEAFASSRGEVLQLFVQFRKYFPDFASYANVNVEEFFKKVNIPMPQPAFTCTNLLSGVYMNKGDGKYEFVPFPELMQISRISTIAQIDWNSDGKKDYVIGGNFLGLKHQFGAHDGMPIFILENQGAGKYRLVMPEESGLFVDGQVKKICVNETADKCRLIFVRNNDKILIYENNKK